MTGKREQDNPLAALLAAAPAEVLTDLLMRLAAERPDVRRECLDYLKKHARLSPDQQRQTEGEELLAIWADLAPDLDEMDECGGGNYDAADHVAGLLLEIERALSRKGIEAAYRRELLDNLLPYIESGNAGLDDALYAVAYAACYSDEDQQALAEALEGMGGDWPRDHARRIYRRLGIRERYLRLRERTLVTGTDYHDLADFHWRAGEKRKAMAVAEQGLRQGKGRMDELRQFVAKRARSAGDRERYLALQFDQAVDPLTCDKYKTFRKLCTTPEWRLYEQKILGRLKDAWRTERLRIRMHRKEHDQAVAVLTESSQPPHAWHDTYETQTARRLESHAPEAILAYYVSRLGDLKSGATRSEYARQAQVMRQIHRLLVDVLRDPQRWRALALKIKGDNVKRPAFQEEFATIVPGWLELK